MVKEIPLGHNRFAIIDDEDYPLISQYTWHINGSGYTTHTINYWSGDQRYTTSISMQRLILELKEGELSDHINGVKTDNRRCNLRKVTPQQNMFNRKRPIHSVNKYKGACLLPNGKWQSSIKFKGKSIYLGRFDFELDAARAYDKKAKELFGEYARLNFPAADQ